MQDVRHHLHQPGRVAFDGDQLVGELDGQRVPAGVHCRPGGLDRARDDRPEQHRFALQRDHPAGDPRHVEQVVDQADQVLDLPLDDVAGAAPVRLAQLLQPQQLHGRADRRQRVAQLVGEHGQELVLAQRRLLQRVGGALERRRPLGDTVLQLGVQPFQRLGLPVEIGEHADLGAQDLWHDRHRHVVHRAALVAAQPIQVGEHDRRHEDDRRPPAAGVLPDHRRQLVAVEVRHADVDQDHGDVGLQQVLQRLAGRVGGDQGVAEPAEDGLVGQQLRRLVVDQQDVDAIDAGGRGGHRGAYLCSHMRSTESSCSVLTGLAR